MSNTPPRITELPKGKKAFLILFGVCVLGVLIAAFIVAAIRVSKGYL